MADARTKVPTQTGRRVSLSNTASNMLSSIFPTSQAKLKAALETIKADISDPAKVKKVAGFDDLYVARSDGMRVVFKRTDDASVITSVAAEA